MESESECLVAKFMSAYFGSTYQILRTEGARVLAELKEDHGTEDGERTSRECVSIEKIGDAMVLFYRYRPTSCGDDGEVASGVGLFGIATTFQELGPSLGEVEWNRIPGGREPPMIRRAIHDAATWDERERGLTP